METSLHHDYWDIPESAKQQTTSVAYDGRTRKMRDLGVRNRYRVLHFVSQISQPRAKNQRDFGTYGGAGLNKCHCSHYLVVHYVNFSWSLFLLL
jgi:hypothetical protein